MMYFSPTLAQFPPGACVTSYSPYASFELKQIARLPGIVQGVVVQITKLALSRIWDASDEADRFAPRTGAAAALTGNFTHTWSLVWSWYSISASASAVFSTTDHMTGFDPR